MIAGVYRHIVDAWAWTRERPDVCRSMYETVLIKIRRTPRLAGFLLLCDPFHRSEKDSNTRGNIHVKPRRNNIELLCVENRARRWTHFLTLRVEAEGEARFIVGGGPLRSKFYAGRIGEKKAAQANLRVTMRPIWKLSTVILGILFYTSGALGQDGTILDSFDALPDCSVRYGLPRISCFNLEYGGELTNATRYRSKSLEGRLRAASAAPLTETASVVTRT